MTNDNQILSFDLNKLPEVKKVWLSDLGFEEIEYIPLMTNNHCVLEGTFDCNLLGSKLMASKEFFLIKFFNSIVKFGNDGSFVAKIGTFGRGPDELQTCHDIESDEDGNLYLVDGWKEKIFIYSPDGEFLRSVKIPLSRASEFRYTSSMFLTYNQNNLGNVENSFNLLDNNGQIVKVFPNKYPFAKPPNAAYGFSHECLFYRFNNRLFTKEVYSDTIYMFENMRFSPHMVIDLGDKVITPQARSEHDGLYLASNFLSPRNLLEFGEYVYYEFTYRFDFLNTETYGFIGSKKDNSQMLISLSEKILNDLDGGPAVVPHTVLDDNTIIDWIDPIDLKKLVASTSFRNSIPKFPKKKKELEKLANSLKETDNPVLILVRLKK
jgi:hypothetical protein